MAELAHAFHWSARELEGMDVEDLMAWHAQVIRINRRLNEDQST